MKCEDVKVIFVPYYETLSLKEVFKKAKAWEEVFEYLPDERDLHRLPRAYVMNLTFTLKGLEFQ